MNGNDMTEEQQPKHLYRISEYFYGSDENLKALSEAFCALFPQNIEYCFGHNVFSDENWDGADYYIDGAIDDFFDAVAQRHGYMAAKAMRDAAYHMLHVFKIIDNYYTGMADAIVDGVYEDA